MQRKEDWWRKMAATFSPGIQALQYRAGGIGGSWERGSPNSPTHREWLFHHSALGEREEAACCGSKSTDSQVYADTTFSPINGFLLCAFRTKSRYVKGVCGF